MAISQVSTANAEGGTQTFTFSLPASLQQNDYVLVATNCGRGDDPTMSETSGTWTKLCDLYANDSSDINLAVWGKVMGATPDTTIEVTNSIGGTTYAYVAAAYRGVDTTTPLDVTATTDTATNGPDPHPPSITPVTAGAKVVVIGASSEPTGTVTIPAGYGNSVLQQNSATNAAAMLADKAWSGSGAETPDVFDVSAGSAADSSGAITIALRPASGSVANTLTATAASFTLTGTATSFKVARKLTAATATYTLTGVAVTLTNGTGEVAATVLPKFAYGMGPMGKPSVHPHPHFSRHKQ